MLILVVLCGTFSSVTAFSEPPDTCVNPQKSFRQVCHARQQLLYSKKMEIEEQCRFLCVADPECGGYKYNQTQAVCLIYGQLIDLSLEPQTLWLSIHLITPTHWQCGCLNGGLCNIEKCQCDCKDGFKGQNCEESIKTTVQYENCLDVYLENPFPGVYELYDPNVGTFEAYCEEGWTYIMKRFDGSQDFNLDFSDYKKGFGNPKGEHWLGNRFIYHMTNRKNYKLRIDFTFWDNGKSFFAEYGSFSLENSHSHFQLHVSDYVGNGAMDVLEWQQLASHALFSTRDDDNDRVKVINCADLMKGAFWYATRGCTKFNPMGPYSSDKTDKLCMFWWHGTCNEYYTICQEIDSHCMSQVTMKMIPYTVKTNLGL